MRILVLGNSQVAALRLAVGDVLPEGATGPAIRDGHEFLFYAQFGGGAPNLYVRDGRLVAPRVQAGSFTTIEGTRVEDGLSLDAFDAVVVSAVGLRADRSDARHFLSATAVAALTERPGRGAVSRGLFERMLAAETRNSPQWGSIVALRTIYAKPLLFQSWPLPTPEVVTRDDFSSARRYGDRVSEFLAFYFAAMGRAVAANAASLSPAAEVLPVPDPAWLAEGFTPAQYGTRDPWHMNADYGALVLDQIVAWAGTLGQHRAA